MITLKDQPTKTAFAGAWRVTMTLQEAIKQAKEIAAYAKSIGDPVAMEVVKTKTKIVIQPFGMHALFKSHKLLHVEPIPK
jgi:hypothetical protein